MFNPATRQRQERTTMHHDRGRENGRSVWNATYLTMPAGTYDLFPYAKICYAIKLHIFYLKKAADPVLSRIWAS